jgi:hypothetical protein
MRASPGAVTITWDGKDLAAIQAATAHLPREAGEPFATVGQGPGPLRLRLGGVPVKVGSVITIDPDGLVRWECDTEVSQVRVELSSPEISQDLAEEMGPRVREACEEALGDAARHEEEQRLQAAAEDLLARLEADGVIEPGWAIRCRWDGQSASWKLVINCKIPLGDLPRNRLRCTWIIDRFGARREAGQVCDWQCSVSARPWHATAGRPTAGRPRAPRTARPAPGLAAGPLTEPSGRMHLRYQRSSISSLCSHPTAEKRTHD